MQNSIKITIPKPCHEDWNKMTPNEQGSFCGKCCKTVVDFTTKTPEEIKNTLLSKKAEKICGRFLNNQLEASNEKSISIKIPFYLLPKNLSIQKAFAIALFFVFGTGLFSCTTKGDVVVGEIAIDDTSQHTEIKVMGDTVYEPIIGQSVSLIPQNQNEVPEPTNKAETMLGESEVKFIQEED